VATYSGFGSGSAAFLGSTSFPLTVIFTQAACSELSGCNLSGLNLSNANLIEADLLSANLSGANLSGADLNAADLFFANLTGANLTGAYLPNAYLDAANLTGANLTGANLGADHLIEANVTGTLLVPADQTVTATNSAGAVVTWSTPPSLPGATPGTCTPPSGSTFPVGTTTVTCQVVSDYDDVATGTFTVTVSAPVQTTTSLESSANPSVVGQAVTYSATVSPTPPGGTVAFTDNGSPIAGCTTVSISAARASCSATPTTAGAHNVVATYSGLENFVGSTSPTLTQVVTAPQPPPQIPCKKLAGCNLSGLNLSNANLASADLQGANLMATNLSGTNLSGANLQGTNLMGTNLSGADLSGAILKGANLNNARWANTTCPDGTNSDNDGGTCVGHT
jgi:uncharacterized protein YjbI with pentapeptide repeats